MLKDVEHHMHARHIPNLISALRILLVFPLAWELVQGAYTIALALFVVAGASDVLDGFLAKRCGWTSRLGGMLDPIADKLLVVTCFLLLGWVGELPWWLVGIVILRDAVILCGASVYYLWIEHFDASPSHLSKANTLAQLLLILVVLTDRGLFAVPAWMEWALVITVAVTTLSSGAGYVWAWSRRARARRREIEAHGRRQTRTVGD